MVEEVTPADVVDRLDDEDAEIDIVDIRKREDFAGGHIPSADNVPLREIEDVVDDREWGDEVVVACYTGQTSKPAARLVNAVTGADATSMAGGFEAWEGDVERDDESRTDATDTDASEGSPAAESASD